MNLFWLDASAIVKRYVSETGTPLVHELFDRVPRSRMLCLLEGIGEVISAFVRYRNARTITADTFRQALVELRADFSHHPQVHRVHPSPEQVSDSWYLIQIYSLNSTDAIILRCALDEAAELRILGHDLVLVSADVRLIAAAQAEGLRTFNPETGDRTMLEALIAPSPR